MNKWIEEKQIIYKAKILHTDQSILKNFESFLDFAIADSRLSFIEVNNENSNICQATDYESDHKAIIYHIYT